MYKVILFNHGQTAANGKVLLDTSSGENPGLTQAVVETKLNEAGSFNYSIVPTHPLYNMTSPLKVYVSVEEDGTEIFYGRILSVQTNPLTKIKSVTCEGALAFLLDAELPKDSADRTSSASDYFKYCINKYNSEIKNDANRVLKIGTINAEGVSEQHTYNNGSYAQIQGVMKSQLLGVHDGFFRIRRQNSTGDHYIDWVKQVGASNPQQIAITHNVISQNNTESGEDIFSMMRPIGNDDITLGDGDDGLLTVSSSMRNNYGVIIRTVTFDAKDASTLRSKATDYIEKIRNRLTITGDISFVDFHFLDGSSTKVHVGDVFNNIEGYEGTKLTAESVSRNLLDAGKDKLTIKNDKDLMNSATASGANSSNTTGVKAGGKVSSGAAHMYKFYHETQTDASITAKNIYISAEKKIEVRAKQVETYADEIDEKLSEEIGKVKVNTDSLQTEWTTYKGTEIYKNKDHIDQVCGLYQVQEYTDPATGETVKNLVVQEGSAIYQTHNGVIMGVYDNYNLTGGMMVQKINGQTETLIKGDLVNIGDTGTTVKLSDKITVVDGGTLIKGLVMFKASDSATNSVSINNGKVTAETVQPTTLTFHGTSGESDYVNLGYATVANMLTNAEVDTVNNTLKIWKIGDAANAPSITFRKATTLSGTWSGSLPAKTLTVKTDDPQGPTYLVQFEGEYSANRTNLEVHIGGAIGIETVMGSKMLSIPVNVSRLTGSSSSGSAPEVVHQTNISAAYNALLTDLTGDNKVIANGTYRPGSDFIGYSAVEVKVPDKAVGTRFGAGNGNYWIEGFYSGESGGPTITGSATGYKLEMTGSKAAAIVQIKYPVTDGTKIPDTAELLVGGLYTEGLNDVTINKNTPWDHGIIQFTKSAGTASTKTVQLAQGSTSWTGAVATVRIWDGATADPQQGGLDTGYDVTVNAGSKLTTLTATSNTTYTPSSDFIGYSSVQVNVPDKAVSTRFGAGNGSYWIEGFYPNESGAPTVSGSSTEYQLGATGSKSSTVVQIKYPGTDGTKIPNTAELTVGSLYTAGLNDVTINKNTPWDHGVIQFTKSAGTASTKTVRLSQGDTSWTGTVAKVRIWDGTTSDPQQGGLDTGYDATVDAGSKLTTLTANSNKTYTPGSGYIGYSSVQVNVPDKAVGTRFKVASGSYYVESYYSEESGTPSISDSSITYQLGTTGSGASTTVQIEYGSGTSKGTKIADTATLSVGSLYNAGYDAVSVPWLSYQKGVPANEERTGPVVTAVTSNNTDGTARSRDFTLTLECNTFTWKNTGYKKAPCVNLKNSSGTIIGRIQTASIWNDGGRSAWLYVETASGGWKKVKAKTTLDYGSTFRVKYIGAATGNPSNSDSDAVFYTNDSGGGGGGGGDSYSHDMYIKCTNKAKTYPGSTVYNYTFVCEGAKDGLTTVGTSLHVYW